MLRHTDCDSIIVIEIQLKHTQIFRPMNLVHGISVFSQNVMHNIQTN